MKETNSSFRTRAERDCVKGLSRADLHALLVNVGLSDEEAAEYCDDPHAIPTSVRKRIVVYKDSTLL